MDRIDPNYFLQLMFNMHVNCTLNDPIIYNEVKLNKKINKDKLLGVYNDGNINDKFCDECYQMYKSEHLKLFKGSVDINPFTWVKICLEYSIKAMNNNDEKIKIPNGCCNMDQCPIKLFYEIIVKNILID